MTHYILGSICFRTPPTPPIWLETQKCAILSTFWESGGKNHPKVEARREKFNIGNFPNIFFMALYICWDYVISFSQHFPMKKFSPSPPTSPSPESGAFFEIWISNGNKIFKIIFYFRNFFLQNIYQSLGTNIYFYERKNNFSDFFGFFTIFWRKKSHFQKKLHFTLAVSPAKFY